MRIIDDEANYFYVVRELALSGKGTGKAPLSDMLMGVFVRAYPDVLSLRFFNSLVTLGILIVLYKGGGIIPVLLFSSTFSSIRWCTRINFETLGTLWFLIGLFHLRKDRRIAGIGFTLAALTRESFLPPLVLFALLNLNAIPYILGTAVVILTIHSNSVIVELPLTSTMVSYSHYALNDYVLSFSFLTRTLQNVLEYLLTSPLLFIGLRHWRELEREHLYLLGALCLTTVIVPGFIINGPFERYTIPTTATIAFIAGSRLTIRKKHIALILLSQFILLNLAVPFLSVLGADSIFDTGLSYDRLIIEKLHCAKEDESIVGFHAKIVRRNKSVWGDRNVTFMLDQKPNWLVVYKAWIDIKEHDLVSVSEIGKFYVIHTESPELLKAVVRPLDKPMWKGKEGWEG